MNKNKDLTTFELDFYQQEGYLVRESMFNEVELLKINSAFERASLKALELSNRGSEYNLDGKRFVNCDYLTIQFEPGIDNKTIKVIEPAHQLDDYLEHLICDPRLVKPIQDIIGQSEISLWTDKLNLKRPREGSGFGWHQDSPYWIHDSSDVNLLPNAYLAIDTSNEDNGCFRVIRGSHLEGCLPGTDNGTQLGGFYTNPSSFDETQQVALEVPAGSLIFFDPHTIHGSGPNQSDFQRRAYIVTYQPGNLPTLKSSTVKNINQDMSSAYLKDSGFLK